MIAKLTLLFNEVKQGKSMKDLKKAAELLKPYVLKHKKVYIGLLFFLLLEVSLTIVFAWFMGTITDAAVQSNFDRLKWLVPLGIGLMIISITSTYWNTFFETISSSAVKKDLRTDLYKHIMLLPLSKTTKHHSGELLSLFTNDVNSINGLIGTSLISLIRLPLLTTAAFIYVMHISWQLSLFSILIAPVGIVAGAFFGLLLRRNSRKMYKLYSDMNTLLNESFQGLYVIKSFTMEKVLQSRYVKQNRDLYNLELENTRIRGWFYSGSQTISSIAFFVSLCLGAYYVSIQQITVGSLLSFINLLNHLIYPLTGIAGLWASFQHSLTAIERITGVLDYPVETNKLVHHSYRMRVNQSIQFDNIYFGYDGGKSLFSGLNLTIPANKVVALVGHSGAGKTSLFNLLLKMYEPAKGNILFDGYPTSELGLDQLRSSIAYVPQESFLFDGTIRENLLIGNPQCSEDEIVKAAKDAEIHEYIMSLPKGYETEIGERGIMLSGGQKQRISIARALLKDAPLLLLDEATSALDNETEEKVKSALDRLMENRTTIVIAHRLSTIQNADLVIVLEEGRIVQTGVHEYLIKEEGLYKKLYNDQYKESTRMIKSRSTIA